MPPADEVPHLRIARPVSDLMRAGDMYCRGLGLRVLGTFEDHDGFDGVMLGVPGADYHFEFTRFRRDPVPPSPTVEDLVVLYVPDEAHWRAWCARVLAAGFREVAAFNPYWAARGRTYEDGDGYRIVLERAKWDDGHSRHATILPRTVPMRVVTPRLHHILDFVTVAAFALAPTFVPLSGSAAVLAYALAIVHLAVTLATRFPGADRRPLSLRAHGTLEAIVGIALIALPFAAGWVDRARLFSVVAGVAILAIGAISRYEVEGHSSANAAVRG